MYPEKKNPKKGKHIAIGVVVSLVFIGLFAGCIAVVMQFVELYNNGKLERWVEANAQEDYDGASEYGYYDEDGYFHYYGETEEDDADRFGYYDEDGEFRYFDEEEDYDPREQFDRPTHDEDIEGYETGEYFSFPADNRVEGLAYSVELREEEYHDGSATDIYYNYPVVKGNVPNVDFINDTICAEWESLLEYYEEDYKDYMYSGDGILAQLDGCVTYMSEDTLSVVYRETVYYGEYLDYQTDFYLYCLNFDMRNGQLLENTGMLDIDEEFVKDFRDRSTKQNGESVLEYYENEDVMYYLEDSYYLILFYCPQGMEIGMNVDEGWVTVTYPDYEEYLKRL